MKSFTQRWREASDEAKDQPMEDTPTDPKEAPDDDCGVQQINIPAKVLHTQMMHMKIGPNGIESVETEAERALAAERADRLQAEVEDGKRALQHWDDWLSSVSDNESDEAPWNIAAGEFARLTAELDAVRKERDAAIKQGANWEKSTHAMESQRDAAQAKCAELEKDLSVTEAARRKWVDAAHDRRVKMEELERLASKAIHSLTKTLSNESLRNDSLERATVLFDAQRSSDKMRALLTPAPPEEKRP